MVKKILKIRAITSIHPGTGSGVGVIDMPVQRERHTGFPIIQGSSVKGSLRAIFPDNDYKKEIFGPENENTDEKDYSSAASFSDARIFAYPVRSLKGVFAWVTCPEVIRRVNFELRNNFTIPKVGEQQIICGDTITVNQNKVVLEEYDFNKINEIIDTNLINFGKEFFSNNDDKNSFASRFAIISDDDFAHFVRNATEISTRIALEKDRKVAKGGALFYEEFLPTETLFYSLIVFQNSNKNKNNTADKLADAFSLPYKIIQFGGDETIGKGFCEVNL
jgi:CRISPR-associated protein Cmr4